MLEPEGVPCHACAMLTTAGNPHDGQSDCFDGQCSMNNTFFTIADLWDWLQQRNDYGVALEIYLLTAG
jgi:hypothetical protein